MVNNIDLFQHNKKLSFNKITFCDDDSLIKFKTSKGSGNKIIYCPALTADKCSKIVLYIGFYTI